jgi:hypothetical protein
MRIRHAQIVTNGFWFLVLLHLLVLRCLSAQQCPQAPVLSPSHQLNLFSEEQEVDFGDILAQHISYSLHVIEDKAVAGYLQHVGDRLLQQMPPTKLRFRFYLVDSPDANAFAIAGGRVYVTRKLIATVHSEDELAGVIAHELGHQLAHHSALDWSRIFHDMLGVTKLGDRSDIEDKYNRVLDAYRTKQGVFAQSNSEREQLGADQVAVYAVAHAGYAPQAVIAFWDRFTESHGRKGNWLTDFVGNTRPESKRLREFVNNLGVIPPACISATGGDSSSDFESWRSVVRNYKGFGKTESLNNVSLKRTLEPALRDEIRFFRFSPDGKYILAQDSTSIFVLAREPLAFLFRIDAVDALNAQFSPDSHSVVFYTRGLRVERWNISEQRLDDVQEVYVFGGCVQTALSPDGNFVACLRRNRDTYSFLDFLLFDVRTGSAVFTKKTFARPGVWIETYVNYLRYLELQNGPTVVPMAFSPDARYFIAGQYEAHLMLDLKSLSEIPVPGALRRVTSTSFAFVGPDQIVGSDGQDLEHASLVRVPSGEVTSSDIPIKGRALYPASKGPYVIVRPMEKAPIGLMDLKAKRIVMASRTDALDIYDSEFVEERTNGEVGLYTQAGQKPTATLTLPRSPLARLESVAVAPKVRTIAMSVRSRGAVWDLTSGERLFYVRGFHGAFFDAGALFFDFFPVNQASLHPVKGQSDRDVHRLEAEEPGDSLARADLANHSIVPIREMKKHTRVHQFGSVIITWAPENEDEPLKHLTLEARDARTDGSLWSRHYAKGFPQIEGSSAGDTAVFSWYLGTQGAKEELRDDSETRKLVDSVKETEGSYLVEIVDLGSGKALAKFPIETGRASFRASYFLAAGSTLLMLDDQRRVHLYSYKGTRIGTLFGGAATLSPEGAVAVEREPGRLELYGGTDLRQGDELTFGSGVAFFGFTTDGKNLVVVTDDQTVFVIDVPQRDPSVKNAVH